jgi:hypothetical protein
LTTARSGVTLAVGCEGGYSVGVVHEFGCGMDGLGR